MALLDGRLLFRPEALVRNSSPVRSLNPTCVGLCATASALWMVLLALWVACTLLLPAWAQTSVDDVHVVPRAVEKSKTEEAANRTPDTSTLNTHVRPLKVAV